MEEATDTKEETSHTMEMNANTGEEDQCTQIVDREVCDLHIVLGLPEQQKVCLISQLVDISGDDEEVP